MKKGYAFIIAIVVFFQAVIPSSLYVEAKDGTDQPEVCTGPSETMSQYFNFQKEAISILGGSKVNTRLLQVKANKEGTFASKLLKLSAIDFLATSIGGQLKSSASNLITSSVLLTFISLSVAKSNINGIAILFKDRSIVRDFKQMLDIETQIFDVAYIRSKEVNLTIKMEGDMEKEIKELVDKYQENGLLKKDVINVNSMASVMMDLFTMNTAMKDFIAMGGESSREDLREYLADSAVDDLDNDYKEVRKFSVCNSYFKGIKGKLSSIAKSNSVKTSIQDIKDAMKRLKKALVEKGWTPKQRKSACNDLTDYEIAQLKAYWGPDWTCGSFIKVSGDISDASSAISSAMSKAKQYFKDKKRARAEKKKIKLANKQKKQEEKAAKKKAKEDAKAAKKKAKEDAKNARSENVAEDLGTTTEEKREKWTRVYGTGEYNPEFSQELNDNFVKEYEQIMIEYQQSLENAIAVDIASTLTKGKGLLNSIDSDIEKNATQSTSRLKTLEDLSESLGKIVGKQCAG